MIRTSLLVIFFFAFILEFNLAASDKVGMKAKTLNMYRDLMWSYKDSPTSVYAEKDLLRWLYLQSTLSTAMSLINHYIVLPTAAMPQ